MAQTGGSGKPWVFDSNNIEEFSAIRDALVHTDQYFFEDQAPTTLAIVMDRILDDLPPEQAAAVRLVYIGGQSLRASAEILGVNWSTVRRRANRGLATMKLRMTDALWVSEMLKGYIPVDELRSQPTETSTATQALQSLGENQ